MIDKAVVLAAGLGKRLSSLAGGRPKPLLPLDGRAGGPTFLDWHLRCLSRLGVREIYIVGNRITCGARVSEMERVRAKWILNDTADLATSGSGHSAWLAWTAPEGILDGRSRVVMMDADIVYHPSLLEQLARAPGVRSKTLVSREFRDTQEEVLVFAAGRGRPRYHGKGLLGSGLVAGCRCVGEATGIVLWEPADHALLRAAAHWCIHYSTAGTRSEHEDITQRLMLAGRVEAVPFGREHLFMEVDTPEEYAVLTEEVYPRLLREAMKLERQGSRAPSSARRITIARRPSAGPRSAAVSQTIPAAPRDRAAHRSPMGARPRP